MKTRRTLIPVKGSGGVCAGVGEAEAPFGNTWARIVRADVPG